MSVLAGGDEGARVLADGDEGARVTAGGDEGARVLAGSDEGARVTAGDVIAALAARGWMLATAESCTGGLVAAALTDLPGSSAVFERGFVTYSNAAKTELLGVDPATLAAHGAVSEPVAAAMAAGALARSRAAIAVAVTGIAGPGGSDHKPEGRVCFGLAHGATTRTETREFGAIGRGAVRAGAVRHALNLVLAAATGATAADGGARSFDRPGPGP